MYTNQQPSIYTTRHYMYDSQANSKNNSALSFDQTHLSQSSNYSNYQPSTSTIDFNDRSNFGQQQSTINDASPNPTRYPLTNNNIRSNSSGPITRGTIEKTNMMSSENPFHDPARSYEQLNSTRTITSITSRPKNIGSINKSLNLSNENPFHAIYGGYHYPSQVDPSKRITNQMTAIRSTDNKSLNLSDANPFHAIYGGYQYPSQSDPKKRITEIPKVSGPLIPTNDLPNNNSFSNYRPSLIREYSAGSSGNGSNSFSTSIADWTRNNPAPLSYRPIQVQRPPPDFYNQNESSNTSSYIPPTSPPRQQRQLSPASPPRQQRQLSPTLPPARIQSQPQKKNLSAPLNKTSLNMSPDNPFAETYGRYYYPSSEEIKIQKRANERNNHFIEQPSIPDNRTMQPTNQTTEYPETENKDNNTGKGNTKFTRFDITF